MGHYKTIAQRKVMERARRVTSAQRGEAKAILSAALAARNAYRAACGLPPIAAPLSSAGNTKLTKAHKGD